MKDQIYILCHDSCKETAAHLGEWLTYLTNRKVKVTRNPSDLTGTTGPFIRYGCSSYVARKDTDLNSASFIDTVANKGRFSRTVSPRGIYTPEFHSVCYNPPQAKDYPVILRTTLCGYGGKGIHVAETEKEFKKLSKKYPGVVWTKFVPTTHELRVHVLGGKVAKIFSKGEGFDDTEYPIRNNERYPYIRADIRQYPKVQQLVNKLQPIIRGKAYSLDLGRDDKNKKYFTFEANSGSGLNESTAEMYARYFIKDLKID